MPTKKHAYAGLPPSENHASQGKNVRTNMRNSAFLSALTPTCGVHPDFLCFVSFWSCVYTKGEHRKLRLLSMKSGDFSFCLDGKVSCLALIYTYESTLTTVRDYIRFSEFSISH